jgi:hypothetical protein
MRSRADIEGQLARLADGTLPPEHARELEARVADSPELQEMLDGQRRSLHAVLALSDSAPPALRTRVEAMRRRPAPKRRARRFGLAGAFTAAAAALAVAVVAILPAGAGGPSVSQAAAFTYLPPTAPAPQHQFDGALNLKVDGVPYPYWENAFGWSAVGKRIDHIKGRTVTTVYYRKGDQRLGYSIVSGKPLKFPSSSPLSVRNGVQIHSLSLGDDTVVTWNRKDHSCILSGHGVSRDELVKLAGWGDRGGLPYYGGDAD